MPPQLVVVQVRQEALLGAHLGVSGADVQWIVSKEVARERVGGRPRSSVSESEKKPSNRPSQSTSMLSERSWAGLELHRRTTTRPWTAELAACEYAQCTSAVDSQGTEGCDGAGGMRQVYDEVDTAGMALHTHPVGMAHTSQAAQ